jgi:hypothetical protein
MIVAQRARDENIRNLATSMTDMLAFVEEVDALKRVRILETVVSDMLREITACALFIQEYVEKIFISEFHPLLYLDVLILMISNSRRATGESCCLVHRRQNRNLSRLIPKFEGEVFYIIDDPGRC